MTRLRPDFLSTLIVTAVFINGTATSGQTGTFQINTQYVTGLSSPVAMAFAPDGRLFVAQQAGVIRVISASGQLLPTPFVTLSGVRSDEERGLLGIAFDPQFTTNNFIYIFYTPGALTRVSRITANGSVAVANSEVVLLEYDNFSGNHRGGDLHFGPDGKLYIATGEAGEPTNSQSVTTLNGKILRLNKDGSIPADNPTSFRTTDGTTVTPAGVYRAIWAIGLRNPFRFAFNPTSGEMRINDVGGGAFEEVNAGVAGSNYGWPTCEGTCTNGFTRNPIYTHVRGPDPDNGCAIVGGAFESGGQFPSTYSGNYFVIDYCRTWVHVIRPDNSVATFPLSIPNSSVDLEFGPDGSLYVLGHGAGVLSHITFTGAGANRNPVAQFTATPVSGPTPLTVSFNSSGSSDPDGDALTFAWEFGDAATATGATTSHTYASPGTYTAKLTVSDGRGGSATKTVQITAGNPPTASITQPAQGSRYTAGQTFYFAGTATDPEDGTLPASAFSWTILFHHDTHTHPALGPLTGVTSGSYTVPVLGHTEDTVFYRIYLTVTDSSGVQTTVTRDVTPRTARITLNSTVAGAQILLDGSPQVAPYTFTGVAGVQRTIDVPSPQTVGGKSYDFSSWSDSGAKSHVISTPATDTTYTATLQTGTTTPAPQPTLYWPFDNNLTESIRNTSTSGRGTLTYSTDRPSAVASNIASLSFDGADATYVAVAGDQILNGWTSASFGVWVKIATTTATAWANNSTHTVMFKDGVIETQIVKDAGGQLRLVATHSDGTPFGARVTSTATISSNSWVHLATVHQGTTVTLYINGQAAGSGSTGKTLGATNTGTLDIVGQGGKFLGLMDDFRTYNSALSAAQISTLVGGAPPPIRPPAAPSGLRIIR
jgi:glucose/arabinose dehydrogenase